MTNYSSQGYCGHQYDKYVDHEPSPLAKMQQQYWATKQVVFKKLGKKEDDCVVASDAELDAKLELFDSIQHSCAVLLHVLEHYQDKLCGMAHEESATGRFLKDYGKQDKTRAGKMMTASGKTMGFTAQQRLLLRGPLVRVYQEVETFQCRAIADTLITVQRMEKARTDYRGALLWMKDVSQQLDPDTFKQLEKFRKVQNHVKKTKAKFDKVKLDTLQKVDLLAASRCNMFSRVLASYQKALLLFWEKTSKTMTSVAESFRGYQHYEFSIVKELTETSKKLADETSKDPVVDDEDDKDRLIFFDAEYHDEDDDKEDKTSKLKNGIPNRKTQPLKKEKPGQTLDDDDPLLNLDDLLPKLNSMAVKKEKPVTNLDLLTHDAAYTSSEKDDLDLLGEIFNTNASARGAPFIPVSTDSFSHQWQATFGDGYCSPEMPLTSTPLQTETPIVETQEVETPSYYLPSQLLDLNAVGVQKPQEPTPVAPESTSVPKMPAAPSKKSKAAAKDMSAWFNLFADLDPLANPDAIGEKRKQAEFDRSC